jgi:hypothetical protein
MRGPLAPERLRRIFLVAVTTASLVLIPWIGYLAVSLPDRHVAGQWKAAWVGFDIVLVGFLAGTAWCAWQRRQLLVPAAIVTTTLLICDAWFDVLLDWGTPDMWWSLATAAAGRAAAGCVVALGCPPVAQADPAHSVARTRARWRCALAMAHSAHRITQRRPAVSIG